MQHRTDVQHTLGGDHAASTGVPVPIGVAALSRLAYGGGDLGAARLYLAEQMATSGNAAACLLDLATVETILGRPAIAEALQVAALSHSRLFRRPSIYADDYGVRVLAIMAPGNLMANTPIDFLLEDSDITLDMLFCWPGEDLPQPLPEHDAIFVAVGESDAAAPLLANLTRQLADCATPLLNRPDRIAGLSRTAVAAGLRHIPGLAAPETVRASRATIAVAAEGDTLAKLLDLPPGPLAIIARPIGSHAGSGLARLDTDADVLSYLEQRSENEFFLSRYVDYRSTDGLFRKYRIVFVEGVPFAGHMAISLNWMVHYLNAGMWDDADKRHEEARWMADFDADFSVRHAAAFAALHAAIGLDYFVIDCAETVAGELLLFEADPAMLVHAMDPPGPFEYKRAPMQKIFHAVQRMIRQCAASPAVVAHQNG